MKTVPAVRREWCSDNQTIEVKEEKPDRGEEQIFPMWSKFSRDLLRFCKRSKTGHFRIHRGDKMEMAKRMMTGLPRIAVSGAKTRILMRSNGC